MVGIYGIGGIGKTTLAKALYNKIANQFEGSCFLSNVREASKQFNGLVQLQENLLNEILKKDDLKVGNLDKGINIIRNRLCSKKVLIVLDDVDKLEQLEALVGGRDLFGLGSKIIVTTRNNHLLSSHGFDQRYRIQGLDQDKALELFSWHAFKKSHPSSNYLDLSERATTYCKGLPLALVVLGSFLCGRDQSRWESILDKFENSQSKEIKDILQISYDGLEDDEKDIFLDISCLFVGGKVDDVKNVLNACHLNLDFGITVLEDLSLITMVENDEVQMHDLIRQMGHKIVHDESSEPGKRSRLWLEKDILAVFRANSGTGAVRAIKLDLPEPTWLEIDAKAFRNMKNLRLLIVRNARFSTKLEYLPNSLNWIEWHRFANSSLPPDFIVRNLVVLDLQHSSIRYLGKGFKDCEWLKRVDLSYSTSLEKVSDFSAAPNLEELCLSNCTNLRTIDESVVSLNKLIILKLVGCSNLKKLPSYFKLKSLELLDLSCCKKLEEIPDLSASSNLGDLILKECTNLRMIHESIGSLDKLRCLNLSKCTKLENLPSCLRLKSLFELLLSGCCKLEKFPEIDENMNSLAFLDLEFTSIKELPSSIGNLSRLMDLNLDNCTNLISLPSTIYLLGSLRTLCLLGCCRFEKFPMHLPVPKQSLCAKLISLDLEYCNISNADFLETLCNVAPFLSELFLSENKFSSLPSCLHKFMYLEYLKLRDCKFLREIPSLPQNIEILDAIGCKSLARSPDNIVDIISEEQGKISREFLLTDCEIPDWFSHRTRTNMVRASVCNSKKLYTERSLAARVNFKVDGDSSKGGAQISCNIYIGNRPHHPRFSRHFRPSNSEYMWLVTTSLAFTSVEKDWEDVSVLFEVREHNGAIVTVKSYGVHVTEELDGIQTDVKRPTVNYTDFDDKKTFMHKLLRKKNMPKTTPFRKMKKRKFEVMLQKKNMPKTTPFKTMKKRKFEVMLRKKNMPKTTSFRKMKRRNFEVPS